MTEPERGHITCHHNHHRHHSHIAVWYDSTGWLYCLECRGWQRIKHRITAEEPKE